MQDSRTILAAVVFVGGLHLVSTVAHGEITSIAGSATVELVALSNAVETERDEAYDAFPDTRDTLPLQVVAQLYPPDNDAAAYVAAQLTDPLDEDANRPADFAINLSLNSFDPNVSYTAAAVTEETRSITLSPAETETALGRPVDLVGRFYLDGALVIFADPNKVDLSSAGIEVTVTVTQKEPDEEPREVFRGGLDLLGQADGTFVTNARGALPRTNISIIDLTEFGGEVEPFTIVTIPGVIIEYSYRATVGQPFELVARVDVAASNGPDIGTIALLGYPFSGWQDVLTYTEPEPVAGEIITAIENERAEPTGTPAFPAATAPLPLTACGLFGVEALLPIGVLGVWRIRPRRSPQRRIA